MMQGISKARMVSFMIDLFGQFELRSDGAMLIFAKNHSMCTY
jgi:hypothetical protein